MSNLTEYLKKAFEYKKKCEYKLAIDYFYKALAIDNESVEIMLELAFLYTKIGQYERANSFYEQCSNKNPDNPQILYDYAMLCIKNNNNEKATEILLKLFNDKFELIKTAITLFELMFEKGEYKNVINLFNSLKNELEDYRVYLLVAKSYDKLEDTDNALILNKKVLELNPNNSEAGYYIADSLFREGKSDESYNMVLNLLKYSETDKLFYLLAEINYSKFDLDSAIKYYSYAIKMNERKAIYYFKLGLVFSLKGYFKEAEQAYNRAINIEPNNSLYNYALAYLYYTNNDYTKAKHIIYSILELEPMYIKALSLKVIIEINENEAAQAGKTVEIIKKLNCIDDFAYYALAIFYKKLNLWDNTIDSLLKAIKINNNSLEYKIELSKSYYEINKLNEAKMICNEIIERNPKFIQALILKSKILIQEEDYEKAINVLDEAQNLDLNSDEIYYLKSRIYINKNDYQQGINNLLSALTINPTKEIYYANIAKCYYKLKDYDKAYLYYKEAADIDITNADYRYYMAKISVEKNNKENALSNFSIMKRLAPYNIEYIEEYARFYANMGNKKAAENILKSVQKNLQNVEDKEKLKKITNEIKKGC